MPSRRAFLAGLTALALPKTTWADVGNPTHLAAARQGETYVLHGLTAEGSSLFALPLPTRGHAAAAHPARPLAVAFARRPGSFALVVDCSRGAEIARLTPAEGRQFNGHGTFSADGSMLYTSEVVAETSEGRIGLWDGQTFARIGEWKSGGIGPHDLRLMQDGSLIVANGGIATDPRDRAKLNIATMQPNITQLSPGGEVLARADLPDLRQNSIRHLALGPQGQIAFAMQWEGDPAEVVPLLGLWTPGSTPRLCPAPESDAHRMKGYAGSIACNAAGNIALTSPKGGVVQIFEAATGAFVVSHAQTDVCGIAPLGRDTFLFSSGTGAVAELSLSGARRLGQTRAQWDNHIVTLG